MATAPVKAGPLPTAIAAFKDASPSVTTEVRWGGWGGGFRGVGFRGGWRGGGWGWRGAGWRGGWGGGWGWRRGWGAGALIGGLALGAAVASSWPYYGGYDYGYPAYAYDEYPADFAYVGSGPAFASYSYYPYWGGRWWAYRHWNRWRHW